MSLLLFLVQVVQEAGKEVAVPSPISMQQLFALLLHES